MKIIDHKELLARIVASKGALPVGILATTDSGAKKTGNPFPEKTVLKTVRAVVWTGVSYKNAVEKQMGREGIEPDFTPDPLPWGEWHVVNKIIAYKGEFYLATKSSPGQRRKQPARLVGFSDINGNSIPKEVVKPFLPEKTVSKKQLEVGLGEGENSPEAIAKKQIWVRTYKFASLKRVRLNGETYLVKS